MLDGGISKAVKNIQGGEKYPRKTHEDANGKLYTLGNGCNIDGENIQPGLKPGCQCFFEVVFDAPNLIDGNFPKMIGAETQVKRKKKGRSYPTNKTSNNEEEALPEFNAKEI